MACIMKVAQWLGNEGHQVEGIGALRTGAVLPVCVLRVGTMCRGPLKNGGLA